MILTARSRKTIVRISLRQEKPRCSSCSNDRGERVLLREREVPLLLRACVRKFAGPSEKSAEGGRYYAQLRALTIREARYRTPSAKMQTAGTLSGPSRVRVHFAGV